MGKERGRKREWGIEKDAGSETDVQTKRQTEREQQKDTQTNKRERRDTDIKEKNSFVIVIPFITLFLFTRLNPYRTRYQELFF